LFPGSCDEWIQGKLSKDERDEEKTRNQDDASPTVPVVRDADGNSMLRLSRWSDDGLRNICWDCLHGYYYIRSL
jgi:hypothetical protein